MRRYCTAVGYCVRKDTCKLPIPTTALLGSSVRCLSANLSHDLPTVSDSVLG